MALNMRIAAMTVKSDNLHNALQNRVDTSTIVSLLAAGANVNVPFRASGLCPLNTAITTGNQPAVWALLSAEMIDVQQADSFRVDNRCQQPIHCAASAGWRELLEALVDRGADPDEPDYGQVTPLHYAAARGHTDIVQYLVELGCDVNHQSSSGKTALWKAVIADHDGTMHYLLSAGADPRLADRTGCTVLTACASEGFYRQLTTLLPIAGAAVNRRDIVGNIPIHAAASRGHLAIACLLLRAGCNVNATNESGNTALHHAALHGHAPMITCLLNHGAHIAKLNAAGQSAIYLAMLHRRKTTVSALHEAGATLSASELDMYDTMEASRYPSKQELLKWATAMFNSPRSLVDLCRLIIRLHICDTEMVAKINSLKLPNALKQFLLFHDEANASGTTPT